MKILKLYIIVFLIVISSQASEIKPLGFKFGDTFSPMRENLCSIKGVKKIRVFNGSGNGPEYFSIDKTIFCTDKNKAISFIEEGVLSSTFLRPVKKKGFKNLIESHIRLYVDSINIKGVEFELHIVLSTTEQQLNTVPSIIGCYLSNKNDCLIIHDKKAKIRYKKPGNYIAPLAISKILLIAKDKEMLKVNQKTLIGLLDSKYSRVNPSQAKYIDKNDTRVEFSIYGIGGISYVNYNIYKNFKLLYQRYLENKLIESSKKNDISDEL